MNTLNLYRLDYNSVTEDFETSRVQLEVKDCDEYSGVVTLADCMIHIDVPIVDDVTHVRYYTFDNYDNAIKLMADKLISYNKSVSKKSLDIVDMLERKFNG